MENTDLWVLREDPAKATALGRKASKAPRDPRYVHREQVYSPHTREAPLPGKEEYYTVMKRCQVYSMQLWEDCTKDCQLDKESSVPTVCALPSGQTRQ